MIRDQIVIGINSDSLWVKLLRDNQLTLNKAEQMCKASEAAAVQNEAWVQKENQVDPVKTAQRTEIYKRRPSASSAAGSTSHVTVPPTARPAGRARPKITLQPAVERLRKPVNSKLTVRTLKSWKFASTA